MKMDFQVGISCLALSMKKNEQKKLTIYRRL